MSVVRQFNEDNNTEAENTTQTNARYYRAVAYGDGDGFRDGVKVCGHRHPSVQAAEKCRGKLLADYVYTGVEDSCSNPISSHTKTDVMWAWSTG